MSKLKQTGASGLDTHFDTRLSQKPRLPVVCRVIHMCQQTTTSTPSRQATRRTKKMRRMCWFINISQECYTTCYRYIPAIGLYISCTSVYSVQLVIQAHNFSTKVWTRRRVAKRSKMSNLVVYIVCRWHIGVGSMFGTNGSDSLSETVTRLNLSCACAIENKEQLISKSCNLK